MGGSFGLTYGLVYAGLIVGIALSVLLVLWFISQLNWLKKNSKKNNTKVKVSVLPFLLATGLYASELSVLAIIGCVAGVLLVANSITFGVVKNKKKALAVEDKAEVKEAKEAPAKEEIKEIKQELASPAEVKEIKEEPVQQEIKAEEVAEESPATDKIKEDAEESKKVEPAVTVGGKKGNFVVIKYSRSFLSKIIQAEDNAKAFYAELKNEILSYGKPKSRISWKQESFRVGRALAVKMTIKGKTLCLNLPLNPADYKGTKYNVEDVSSVAKNADAPALYRVSGTRKLLYAKDLIAQVMAKFGLEKKAIQAIDYAKELPYETDKALIKKGLIKVLTDEEASSGTQFAPAKQVAEVAVSDTVKEEGKPRLSIKYSRSFASKIMQAKEDTKAFYSELKNELLSYAKVKDRLSWKHESYRVGRALAVKMTVKGKTLCLNLALDPAKYADTKYKIEDVSSVAKNADAPALYRITSARKCGYAKDLIAKVMANFDLEKVETKRVDYVTKNPFRKDETLIKNGLIKVLK